MCAWCVQLLESNNSEDQMDAAMLRRSGIFNQILNLLNDSCNNQNATTLMEKVNDLKYTG